MSQPHSDAGHRLGFQTLDAEVALDSLPVAGTLPSWLTGTLLRNGPARFEVGARSYRHWFDGLAMLHRFSIADGTVSYANRYLDSKAHRAATESGAISYSEFATDPCRSLFQRVCQGSIHHAMNTTARVAAPCSWDRPLPG